MRTLLSGLATLVFAVLGLTMSGHAGPISASSLERYVSTSQSKAPLVQVQMADPRIAGLEEEVRRLNGKVEELNFLILQMQDQVRRMQEDNEFRFQELENGKSNAGASGKRSELPAQSSDTSTKVAGETPRQPEASLKPEAGTGQPPKNLGSVTFDRNGHIIAEAVEPSSQGSASIPTQADTPVAAVVPPTNSPDEAYQNAYETLLAGDYRSAEAGFRHYLQTYPDHKHIADATFWLGDSILNQGRPKEAAEIFLKASKDFPDAPKAPEMLLNLGISLAGMNQKQIACATFEEVVARYPKLSNALKERVKRERVSVGC